MQNLVQVLIRRLNKRNYYKTAHPSQTKYWKYFSNYFLKKKLMYIFEPVCSDTSSPTIHIVPGREVLQGWHMSPIILLYIAGNYSTGVQIVSCTLSDDSVLSESTGLFNPVLCVSQWNLFWQKNQPMRLCLSNQVRSAREWFPSPLGDFIRLFEGLIGELFQIWHWNMFYFFKWHQSGP